MKVVRRVGIIGTGIAGLATAKTLSAEGLECTLFERGDRVGGVWADGYSSFGVQAPKELYEFPDWPLPEGAPTLSVAREVLLLAEKLTAEMQRRVPLQSPRLQNKL